MRVEEGFQPETYALPKDAYTAAHSLRSLLQRILPAAVLATVEADLHRFSKRLHGDVQELARLADGPANEPRLMQYDQYGRRIDRLETSEGWRKLKGVAAQEGLVGIQYERETEEFSRVHVFAKTYLWVGDSRMVGCPMSMTDGAARVIELFGTSEMKSLLLPRLIHRDPKKAWTAGQFMTEKPGGSDVSRTETIATHSAGRDSNAKPGDLFLLDGFKWFSSATDGEVALSLARTGNEGSGSAGLSLFLLPLKTGSFDPVSPPSPNGIFIHRLKNKVGTKTVPTAELSISGARGYLIGEVGAGVRTMTTVLNITRIHSAFYSLGSIGRALSVASSYAKVRRVLDHSTRTYVLLKDLPLHTSLLADVALVHHALLHLLMPVAHLLGLSETSKASAQQEAMLRLLTPVAKAFAGVRAAGAVEDCMEAMGGLGYMEEEGLGRLARDVLVERIWEGTSNVLALDVCRVIQKSKHTAMDHYMEWADTILKLSGSHASIDTLRQTLKLIRTATMSLLSQTAEPDPRLPGPLLHLVGHTTAALDMVQQANWASKKEGEDADFEWGALKRWLELGEKERSAVRRLVSSEVAERESDMALERDLVYGRSKL